MVEIVFTLDKPNQTVRKLEGDGDFLQRGMIEKLFDNKICTLGNG